MYFIDFFSSMLYDKNACNNSKTKIPVYFLATEDEIKYQYVTPVELYKIFHWNESIRDTIFRMHFRIKNGISFKNSIFNDLEVFKALYQKQKGYQCKKISQPENEEIDTIKPDNYSDLLSDASKVLHYCIDIYGNIVEVFVPNDKINDKKYWIAQAQQYKLLCDFDYLPFHYSSRDEGLKEVREEMIKKICRKTTAYCFYDTEMEGEYYKCYGIKFPVEEKEEMLQTIKSHPSKSFTNDFPKVIIYYEDKIEKQLESKKFFHETSFAIGDTKIDLTPSKEKMGGSRSSLEYDVAIGYLPTKESPETEVITLIDSNKSKDSLATTSNEFVARITIDRKTSDGNYGKVTKVELGIKNKEPEQKYEAAEARKLLLVSCARKTKDLAKTTEESFLDLVLRNPEYYTSKTCSVRLPDCYKLITGDWSREELEKEVKLCTDSLSDGGNMIIPMVREYPDSTSHMFVIVANKKGGKTRFKIFDPSTALKLEDKNKIKQGLGKYIYENLDEKYILSPDTPIQNALGKHNPIFSGICTGVSMEYINYIIDNKQDKNPQQLTEEEGKKIQISYAQNVIGNGLHHMILGEQQIDISTLYDHVLLYNNATLKLVKYSDYKKDSKKYKASDVVCAINGQEIIITSNESKFNNDIPGITKRISGNGEYKYNYVIFPAYANNRQLKLLIYTNGKTFLYDKMLEDDISVDLTGFDTKLFFNAASNIIPENSNNKSSETVIKSEETKKEIQQVAEESQTTTQAKNTLQEKATNTENKSLQETKQVKQDEVVDKKEVKPEAVSIAVNDTDKKPIQEEITVRNAPVETPKEYPIETKFVDNKLNMDLIKHKEEEQKKKETGSIIPALQDVDKVQTHKENKEESGTFNLLSDILRNKEKDNKEQKSSSKKDNRDQEQETVKDSGLTERKSNQIYK